MTSAPVASITDDLLAEIEFDLEVAETTHALEASVARDSLAGLLAELRSLRVETEGLRKVCKDVAWRVSDTCDQLQATGFDGDRRYGLDEWSAPIKNLNMAVGILERAMQSNTEGK